LALSARTFIFKVDCPPERVTALAFGLATDTFVQILTKAEAKNWPVHETKIASVHLSARPVVMDDAATTSFGIIDRLAALTTTKDLSRDEVIEFKPILDKMSSVVNNTNADVILSTGSTESRFTAELLNEAESIARKASRRSFGHVTGTIDKLVLQPDKGNRSIGLVDHLTGLRVTAVFDGALDRSVNALHTGSVVDIKGFIRSNSDKSLHLDAEDIEKIKKRHHQPVNSDDLEGILDIELPDGLNSVNIIRTLRDGDASPARKGDD
jgi:hypothetical protein